ncbi:unnamed protein product [Toxocara canis]|uniref:Uncharacterized protein n=1 Tax=Toxocara canis TaxID=6265 RepID=A0A3P7IE81_TOXCA|nr:unnamed protein product [Toxocara canis]
MPDFGLVDAYLPSRCPSEYRDLNLSQNNKNVLDGCSSKERRSSFNFKVSGLFTCDRDGKANRRISSFTTRWHRNNKTTLIRKSLLLHVYTVSQSLSNTVSFIPDGEKFEQ